MFSKAIPVWITGKEKEMNICMNTVFICKNLENPVLKITGSSFYQVFADNKLIHFGPAKKGRGFTSVDTVNLPENVEILIRTVGYNCKSFNGVKNVSFLQAEIICSGDVVAATGVSGFEYFENKSYIQKVTRYSEQRQFLECWDLTRGTEKAEISKVLHNLEFLSRDVPYSDFDEIVLNNRNLKKCKITDEPRKPLFHFFTDETIDIFPYDEIEEKPYETYIRSHIDDNGDKMLETFRFDNIECGFFKLEVESEKGGSIILAFAEQLDNERPNLSYINSCNAVKFTIPKGRHTLYSIMPVTALYGEILHLDNDVLVNSVSIYEFAFPKRLIKPFECKDEKLQVIYNAAVRSFRHNVLDIFMDCPSRERGGYLCDGRYMAEAEYCLTGKNTVEKAFLKNFLMGGQRESGIIEMCYPSEDLNGMFIPQWMMWFLKQLYEHFTFRDGMSEKEKYRDIVYKALRYFEKFENEYSLLEKLDGWNFLEWSKLNGRTHDVSWPTNMVYFDILKKMGIIYNDESLIEKSQKIKDIILDMAYDGKMFKDRAMRVDGKLENTDEFSETTQYYALYFGLADESNEYINNLFLGNEKLPDNAEPSGLFMGIYLKLELLLKRKEFEIAKKYIIDIFYDMAIATGTLWEQRGLKGSLDHGFPSYVTLLIQEIEK